MSEAKPKVIRTILATLITVLIIGTVILSLLLGQKNRQITQATTQPGSTPTVTAIPPEILAQLSEAEQAMNEKNFQDAAEKLLRSLGG